MVADHLREEEYSGGEHTIWQDIEEHIAESAEEKDKNYS